MNFVIVVEIVKTDEIRPEIKGFIEVPMLATNDHDNEENAVRLSEQMVRDCFKRWREKNVLNHLRK